MNLDNVNLTELVALCRKGPSLLAHRGLGREVLIKLINEEIDPDSLPIDPVDDERELMCFLQVEYPAIIKNQLKCSDQGYFCPDCPPGRVISCASIDMDPGLRQRGLYSIGLGRKNK